MSQFRPALPTVYLDHAQMVDAFRGANGLTTHKDLAEFVVHAAREANLCLSVFHLFELTAWEDASRRHAMAEWLDTIPIVWTDHGDRAKTREAEEALVGQMNLLAPAKYLPFVGNLSDAYRHASPGAARWLDTSASVSVWVETMRAHNLGTEPFRNFSLGTAAMFTADRKRARLDGPRNHIDVVIDRQVDSGLRDLLYKADERLRRSQDPRYRVLRGPTPSLPCALDVARAVGVIVADQRALPAWYVGRRAQREYSWRLPSNADPLSANFAKKHAGATIDWFHSMVGAAYADVFTCDTATRQDIGSAREELGRMPALGADVQSLNRQFDQCLSSKLAIVASG